MKEFRIHRDGWLDGAPDDSDEAFTFTRLIIAVGGATLTRNLSSRHGGSSEGIIVPLLPLVQRIADSWWPLLYEPFRSGAGAAFKARHRLDTPMHGYVFPRVALCSGGDDSLLTAWAPGQEHARIEFLAPPSEMPETLAREPVENSLMEIVDAVVARLDRKRPAPNNLTVAWDRVKTSIGNIDELTYCKAAGRLGLDPYDPLAPDLTNYMSQVSDTLFEDISAAAFVEELLEMTEWLGATEEIRRNAPEIEVSAFGKFPQDSLDLAPWQVGQRAADALRRNAGLSPHQPRRHLEQLFGEIVLARSASFQRAPAIVSALIERHDKTARIATVARTAREQRFKACTAAYIAWASNPGEDRAVTPAFTRLQQAGRAFAAELLAPQQYLQGRAPSHGFTSDGIEQIAGDLVCPYETVVWQAFHARVPLRGIELPAPQHPMIV